MTIFASAIHLKKIGWLHFLLTKTDNNEHQKTSSQKQTCLQSDF